MCLIINKPKDAFFDDDFLKGVYNLNSDGIGVMYAENNALNIQRIVPRTEAEALQFWHENIAHRECVVHFRMKTHGDIDLRNCHPYQVISAEEGYPLYLVHNGILSTGNAADKSLSDTAHYIQDFLRPMLLKNPEFFMTDAFRQIISSHIGFSNKFVLMDAYGNTVTINRLAGVQHNGAWLSNTYAWDTTGTVHDRPAYKSSYGGYSNVYGYGGRFDDDDAWGEDDKDPVGTNVVAGKATTKAIEDEEAYDEAIDFACELFDTAQEMGINLDSIHWFTAENYFHRSSSDLAWGLVEAVGCGAYTQDELIAELTQYDIVEPSDTYALPLLPAQEDHGTMVVTV